MGEVNRIVKKLGSRPSRIVKNSLVNRTEGLCDSSVVESSYQDFVNAVKRLGFQVQVNP